MLTTWESGTCVSDREPHKLVKTEAPAAPYPASMIMGIVASWAVEPMRKQGRRAPAEGHGLNQSRPPKNPVYYRGRLILKSYLHCFTEDVDKSSLFLLLQSVSDLN